MRDHSSSTAPLSITSLSNRGGVALQPKESLADVHTHSLINLCDRHPGLVACAEAIVCEKRGSLAMPLFPTAPYYAAIAGEIVREGLDLSNHTG